jgi:ribosomal protein S18 acetylase RimI-like enzyme
MVVGQELGDGRRVIVRLAAYADAAAIAATERATSGTPGLLVGRPGEIPLEAYAAKIRELSTRGRYVVAELDGHVIGHAFLDPFEMIANAHVFRLTVVVHPGHVGRRIGRTLLDDLLAWGATDPRVGKVELLVRATNDRAMHLYRAVGFLEEGRFRQRVRLPDGSFVDDIAMAWFPNRAPVDREPGAPAKPE